MRAREMMRSLMKVMRLLVASAVLGSIIQVDDYESFSKSNTTRAARAAQSSIETESRWTPVHRDG